MPTKINDATRIIDLTVGQLEDLTRAWVRSEVATAKAGEDHRDKRHVYGGRRRTGRSSRYGRP